MAEDLDETDLVKVDKKRYMNVDPESKRKHQEMLRALQVLGIKPSTFQSFHAQDKTDKAHKSY